MNTEGWSKKLWRQLEPKPPLCGVWHFWLGLPEWTALSSALVTVHFRPEDICSPGVIAPQSLQGYLRRQWKDSNHPHLPASGMHPSSPRGASLQSTMEVQGMHQMPLPALWVLLFVKHHGSLREAPKFSCGASYLQSSMGVSQKTWLFCFGW